MILKAAIDDAFSERYFSNEIDSTKTLINYFQQNASLYEFKNIYYKKIQNSKNFVRKKILRFVANIVY